ADHPTPTRSANFSEDEMEKLKSVVAGQEKRIQQLEQLVEAQKKLIDQALHLAPPAQTAENSASGPNPEGEKVANASAAPPAATEPIRQVQDDQASPLALRIGKVSVNPYGFLDFTTVIRDRDVGSGGGTNFGGIPFANSVNGHLSEFRFTAQNSRVGVRFDAHHGGADVLGFIETDFVGNSPGNAPVTTNSNGIRMRLFWMDARKGKLEILGGQSWSLLTPNRKGVSPVPNDVFSTYDLDTSNQVGLTWARDPQFRVIYHANRTVTLGVSLEAAEQYGGGSAGAGEITLPAALESSYNSQINRGETTYTVPNLHPDVIAKVAFDPKLGNRDLHLEVAGLLSGFRFFNPQDQTKHNATGGGVLVGLNYEMVKNFRLIANGFYSNGGGRWIFGLGPDVIINANGKPSLVHAASTVSGFEYQASAKDLFDAYYGGAYVYRSAAVDLNGQLVGYGYTGSPSNHNRSLQQITLGYTRTFWRDPNYGALQFLTQYSYLVRHPWFVPIGQPAAANLNSLFLSIRYVLPGAPPAQK
ncbi:MAG TPA: hypothetical protein VE961_25130, partial [Pyrinomonadaceae bacterium]|nr:hypothetical protein [Pyrinomonadaceae bacterium]